MLMWDRLIGIIDWFIPSAAKVERSEHGLARNFVFTHLFGPALSQSISVFLYLSGPDLRRIARIHLVVRSLPLRRGEFAVSALADHQPLARLLLFVGAPNPCCRIIYRQYSWLLFCLSSMGLPGTCSTATTLKSRLDLNSVRNDLYVVDGNLLRQYDCDAFRSRTRSGEASRNCNPSARSQRNGRRGQSREVDFSCQDESRIADAVKCRDRIQ